MDACHLLGLLFTVAFAFTTVKSCMVTYEWKPLTLEETIRGADIVVFGQESEHIHSSRWSWGTDAVFHVYCVIKHDGGPAIPERIIIQGVRPIHSCMGTFTRLGEVMMLALKRTESGNFRWHEIGIMQTAKFPPTQDNLQRALQVTGQEIGIAPEGRDPLAQPGCFWTNLDKTQEEQEGEEEEDEFDDDDDDEEEEEEEEQEEQEIFTVTRPTYRYGRRNGKHKKKMWPKKEQAVEIKRGKSWNLPNEESYEEQGSGEFHINL